MRFGSMGAFPGSTTRGTSILQRLLRASKQTLRCPNSRRNEAVAGGYGPPFLGVRESPNFRTHGTWGYLIGPTSAPNLPEFHGLRLSTGTNPREASA